LSEHGFGPAEIDALLAKRVISSPAEQQKAEKQLTPAAR